MEMMASSVTPGYGRRARNRHDTRGRLVEAARVLFGRRGFDHSSMAEIARRAGVSRRTCFRYFPCKEDLAFPFRDERLARFDLLVRERSSGESAYAAVKRACLVLAGDYMARRDEVLALERIVREHATLRARDREHDREWEQLIAAALAGDAADPHLPRLLAGAVIGLVRAALDLWLEADDAPNLVALAHEVFALLDHGAPRLLAEQRPDIASSLAAPAAHSPATPRASRGRSRAARGA